MSSTKGAPPSGEKKAPLEGRESGIGEERLSGDSPEGSPSATAAREFLLQLGTLLEFLFAGQEEGGPVTLARVEEMDLAPLLSAQAALDREGPEALMSLPLPELLLLSHRIERLSAVLAPFAAPSGPLASRIAAITGQGPEGAYRKAGRDSGKLFGRKILGRA